MAKRIYCPYLDKEVGASAVSKEHIVPEGLGGSNQFIVKDISSEANSSFGTYIDAPFIRDPLVSECLHNLKIKNKDGKEHTLHWDNVEYVHENSKYLLSMTHTHSEGWKVTFKNASSSSETPEGRKRINILSKPDEASSIKEKLEERWGNKGKKIEFLEDKIIDDLNPRVSRKISLDYKVYAKEFIKISIGSSLYCIGDKFHRTEDLSRLRSMLLEKGSPSTELQRVCDLVQLGTDSSDGVFDVLTNGYNHLIMFMYIHGQCVCLINLFGAFQCTVPITTDKGLLALFPYEVVFEINPKTKEFKKRTLVDLIKQNAGKFFKSNII